ncbi:hypothetical protein [Vibrio gangliei]|uniref:hypothetical protein n=1 Tax=Vibrio gangliei TaxID=2077090 RepID=UPI000D014EA6|nr:hypothetical protein [Vibrio gangliei]
MKNWYLFALLAVSTNLSAEPSRSISYLMEDSLSMFDWGVFRMESSMTTIKFKELDLISHYGRADYDWDSNRINLETVVYPSYKSLEKLGSKAICRQAITQVKEHFGYGIDEDDLRALFGIPSYFKHTGYVKKNVPESLGKDLENATKFSVQVYASKLDKAPYNQYQHCVSSFNEKGVMYVEE